MSHASRPPSDMKSILLCPGKVNFKQYLISIGQFRDDSDKSAANEGSMLHDLTEYCIHDCFKVRELKDEGFTHEQVDLVDTAMMNFNDMMFQGDPITMITEVKRHLPEFTSKYDGGIFGTVDVECIIGTTLYIKDWKFGSWPVSVGTKENPNAQLATYAVMAVQYWMLKGVQITHINLSVCQPRNDDAPEIILTIQELTDWYNNILFPGLVMSYANDAPLIPGPEQCEWCACRFKCKPRYDYALEIVERAKEVYLKLKNKDNPFAESVVTIAELCEIQAAAPVVNKIMKEVGTALYSEAMAGEDIPGFKLVEGRKNRTWHSESDAVSFLMMKDVDPEDLYISKFVSVAQAEKLNKEFKKDSGFSDLVSIYRSSPRLVEEHKPGKRYTGNASDAFSGFGEK